MALNVTKKTSTPLLSVANDGKALSLAEIMGNLNSKYGSGMAIIGDSKPQNMPRIPSSNPEINQALGGGVPIGKILEIYGAESSGKTTFCLDIAANAQRMGMPVVFIDAEHALDQKYAADLGVSVKDMLIIQPDCGEDALNALKDIIDMQSNTLFILDSIAALTPRSDLEGDNAEVGKSQMGQHAKLMSTAYKQILAKVKKSNSTLLLTNQMRMKIGFVLGDPRTTPGGEATKFYASIRIYMGKDTQLMDGDTPVGQRSKFKIIKNKTAPVAKEMTVDIYYGKGFDNMDSLVNMAVAFKIIDLSGAWYSMGERKLGQGKTAVKELMENDNDFRKLVEDGVSNAINTGVKVEPGKKKGKK